MTVRIDITQTSTIEPGPLYRVLNQVTYAENIPANIFVINTETEKFEHVATVWDLQNFPFTRTEAINNEVPYFLSAEGVKDFTDIQTGLDFAANIYSRVQWLARDYAKANNVFEGVVTHTIVS